MDLADSHFQPVIEYGRDGQVFHHGYYVHPQSHLFIQKQLRIAPQPPNISKAIDISISREDKQPELPKVYKSHKELSSLFLVRRSLACGQ